jgi:hypothetical protein
MNKAVQLGFHNVVSKTSLVHGSECWTLRTRDKQRIDAAQMRFLCKLKRVALRDRQRSENTGNLSEVDRINDDIEVYEEKWRSHVHRMPDYRLSRRVFNSDLLENGI